MLDFISRFLSSPMRTGAVLPSSVRLARALAGEIDFSSAITIVELGAGTGVVTRELLKRMSNDSKLLVFEINPMFCDGLERISDDRLEVVREDARHLSKIVKSAEYVGLVCRSCRLRLPCIARF